MKASALILLFTTITLFAAGNAIAECDCRQPAYKDQIDFLTRYMACLDDCLNAQMQQIRLDIKRADRRLYNLEDQIDRLHLKIKNLENERFYGEQNK